MAVERMLEEKLSFVRETLALAEKYDHAANVLMYDQETICPPDGMEEQGEVMAFLSNESFKLIKKPAFIEAAEYLYEHRKDLSELDRVMAEQLHRAYLQNRNVTPELQHDFTLRLREVERGQKSFGLQCFCTFPEGSGGYEPAHGRAARRGGSRLDSL